MNTLSTLKTLNILLIDDNISSYNLLRNELDAENKITYHNNGREALIWLYQYNFPDIIIIENNVPILNGFDFVKEIKCSALFSNIPIVMLSDNDKSEGRIKCINAGADDFLSKPFNPRELSARMFAILRRVKQNIAA